MFLGLIPIFWAARRLMILRIKVVYLVAIVVIENKDGSLHRQLKKMVEDWLSCCTVARSTQKPMGCLGCLGRVGLKYSTARPSPIATAAL